MCSFKEWALENLENYEENMEHYDGTINCSDNNLTSLEHAPYSKRLRSDFSDKYTKQYLSEHYPEMFIGE